MDLSYHVLIVDDVIDNIQVAMNILKEDGYNFSFATSGNEALELMEKQHFDIVLLDVMMPGITGFEVCKVMKKIERLKNIPVIFLTAKTDADAISEGFNSGAADYLIKPFHANELLMRVKNHLELYMAKETLRHHNIELQAKIDHQEKRLLTELEENQKEIIYLLTGLMESSSDETGKHIRRVAEYSRLLAHYHPSLDKEDEETIAHAAPMHDIGKISISREILHKPGKLDANEFEIMKTHTTKGHEFLRHSQRHILKAADVIAMQHHEKWDGTGYPQALGGEEIHLYGRIVAVADVFDALTHKREYKEAWSVERAVDYIKEQRGLHFDPLLVDIFLEHVDEFIAIKNM